MSTDSVYKILFLCTGHEFEQTLVKDREGWGAAAHGVTELHTTEQLNKRQRCKGRIAVLSEETNNV